MNIEIKLLGEDICLFGNRKGNLGYTEYSTSTKFTKISEAYMLTSCDLNMDSWISYNVWGFNKYVWG